VEWWSGGVVEREEVGRGGGEWREQGGEWRVESGEWRQFPPFVVVISLDGWWSEGGETNAAADTLTT
jgi:hypothetical protein